MKILIDARPFVDPHAGGVTKFALGVVEALMKAMPDAAFTLVTTGLRHTQYTIPNTRYSSRHVLIPNKLWSFLSMIGVVSLDRVVKDKPDLLFLPNLGFTGRPHTPYFLLVHDLSFLIEPRWFRLRGRLWHRAVQAKRLIREARHLFAVSERTKQDLIEQLKIPADNITVIPIGLDPVKTFDELPLPLQGKRFVLAMGHGNTRKNSTCAQVAVEALRRDPKFSDVILILVGANQCVRPDPGTRSRPIDRPGQTHGSAPTVFLTHPSDSAIATLMKHASTFLYPSWYEGFGIPLHEAARFGTPCISSTASALPETAPAGTIFADPAKPHHWAEGLKMILKSPTQYKTQTPLEDWVQAAAMVKEKMENLEVAQP